MRSLKILFVLISLTLVNCSQDNSMEEAEILAKPNNNKKVDICHYDADTDTWKTLNISENAVDAHLAHGDAFGNCDDTVFICKDEETLRVNKYELESYEPFVLGKCDSGQVPGMEYTYVPDDNFETALIDLGLDNGDNGLDNLVLTANISGISSLNVKEKGIKDLTGIEDFIELISLFVHNNDLQILDISKNTKIGTLYCFGNNLTTLDLTSNINLVQIQCQGNKLKNLNINNLPKLKYLYGDNNQLKDLDISNNTDLLVVFVRSNLISNVNLTNTPSLNTFSLVNNLLESADLSQNMNLRVVSLLNNKLTELNMKNGNNGDITTFNLSGNPDLLCIQVDNATDSTLKWTNIDPWTSFSEDCGY